MKNLPVIACIFLLIVLGCSDTNSSSNISRRSVEEQIVFLDTNKIPDANDVKVKRAAFLLDYLAENTTSSRKEIGDITTGTVDIIKNKYGKQYLHQDILEAGKRIIDAIPANKRGKKDNFQTIAYLITVEASTK